MSSTLVYVRTEYVRTEYDGFMINQRMHIKYNDQTYSVTDPALQHLLLEYLPVDSLRQPGVFTVVATERKRVPVTASRLALVR